MVRHLYLHIPFCRRLCPYCAFYKHEPGKLANRAFIDAIVSEAETRVREGMEIAPRTIFFGGGTPSLLSPAHLERLCAGLAKVFDLREVEEWTIEANPATFDEKKARLMRDVGINRSSLGIQSFQPDILRTLGRDHRSEDAVEAFGILRAAGFANVSLDLMFSIPGQSAEMWSADLETALGLKPEHVSCYNLTYEEDTAFMARHLNGDLDADEGRDETLYFLAMDRFESSGYRHYEISNYAKPGLESLHNQAYWMGQDYLGLGPGAVTTVAGRRWKTLADTARYVQAVKNGIEVRTEEEQLSEPDRHIETVALRLRTAQGVPRRLVEPASSAAVENLISQGLIAETKGFLSLTRRGSALADAVAAELI